MEIIKIFNSLISFPLPLISTAIFLIFKFFPPKKISSWYGYRTKKSSKNIENWTFSQKFSANSGLLLSVILLIVQVLVNTIVDNEPSTRNIIGFMWLVGMIAIIYLTENKLKNK